MNRPLILVVEDERLIARDIAMQLQGLGYTPVGPATTGEQAIEMAGLLRPQLVLMDVHLASALAPQRAAAARAQTSVRPLGVNSMCSSLRQRR